MMTGVVCTVSRVKKGDAEDFNGEAGNGHLNI